METIKTRTAEIYLDDQHILHIVFLSDVTIDVDDAADNFLVVKHLTNNESCVKLMDIRNHFDIDNEAKKFSNSREYYGKTKARALLVNSEVKKITLNFFGRVNPGKIPIKFFTDENEAIEWLKKYQ
ncbi:MAG TPA: hypothetical protein VNX68_12560 [Nitrosopumilaceae archaeon]|nr:hypothetical protein [Nitrosopumilaceae archaeon]